MAQNNSYLDEYVSQCFMLARTIRVKFKDGVGLTNEDIVSRYGESAVDLNRPETWKWYMNNAGQYHVSDVPMTVISIDTLEEIIFSAENLEVHTATKKAYEAGTRNYQTLLYRYPSQKPLIDGILNPADMETMIAAEDGEVIAYDPQYVENNEATLIQDLSIFLKRVTKRWYNGQFVMSNNLYTASYLAQLYAFLVPEILSQRLKRCKTEEVHSFHLRMYLSSHSNLGSYLPYLTLKQALWLYRNILRLERNAGKNEVFDELVEHLLTERGIPLASYTVRQELAEREDYRPNVRALRKYLNEVQNVTGSPYTELEALQMQEQYITPGNFEHLEQHAAGEVEKFEIANSGVTQTRVLDSTMTDYSNSIPETFEMVAMRQWCYLANHGLYRAVISYKNVATGEIQSLPALDAFVYMYYLALSANGYLVDRIPEYYNARQRRHPKPSVGDLMSVVPERAMYRAIAKDLLKRQPVIQPCSSVSEFYAHVSSIFDECYYQWYLISSQSNMEDHGYVSNIVNQLYATERTAFNVSGATIEAWLVRNNLPAFDLDRETALAQVTAIYEAGTGIAIDQVKRLADVQKALLELFKQLSPYPLQFIRHINEDPIINLNRVALRFDEPKGYIEEYRSLGNTVINGRADTHAVQSADIQMLGTGNMTVAVNPETVFEATIPAAAELQAEVKPSSLVKVPISHIGFTGSYEGQDAALDIEGGALGYTLFDQMDDSLKARAKSKYSNISF